MPSRVRHGESRAVSQVCALSPTVKRTSDHSPPLAPPSSPLWLTSPKSHRRLAERVEASYMVNQQRIKVVPMPTVITTRKGCPVSAAASPHHRSGSQRVLSPPLGGSVGQRRIHGESRFTRRPSGPIIRPKDRRGHVGRHVARPRIGAVNSIFLSNS